MKQAGRFSVIGIGVDAVDIGSAVERIMNAAMRRQAFSVTALAVHGLALAAWEPELRARLNEFDLVTPDGQPVRWALNLLYGVGLSDRVAGPDLTVAVVEAAAAAALPIYLYGSTEQVLEHLASNLRTRFPSLVIAGREPSRFAPATRNMQSQITRRVVDSGARVLLVGIGCPRQEWFVHALRDVLPMPALAVGAAFDFHAGLLPKAPEWMQRAGLEWLYRLRQEPRRLWKRYLTTNPYFLYMLARQWLGLLHPPAPHAPTGRGGSVPA